MLTIPRVLLSVCAVVFLTPPLSAQEEPKSSSTLITATEIQQSGVTNAFDAVQLLRPRWLRAREVVRLPSSGNEMQMAVIHVFIEDRDQGDIEFLKTIPAERIYTLRYMSLNEAGARFGPTSGPAIVVTMKH